MITDDTKIIKNDHHMVQQDIDNDMIKWSNDRLLLFHPDKYKALRIGKSDSTFMYSIDGTKINYTDKKKKTKSNCG